MNKNKGYFEFSDGWVFTSLFMYDSKFKKVNLTNIIANGDALNHSIFEIKELQSAFVKLVNVGLIEIENNSLRLTEKGCVIKEKVTNDKGGFFQRIDNTLSWINKISILNSNSKLPQVLDIDFLNEVDFEIAYENYKKQ